MPLQFHTLSQHMTFVDQITETVTHANDLAPFHAYDVFVVLANTDAVEHNAVQVSVTHSAFGIGLPGGTSGLIQPDPVDVPPALDGDPGLATVRFTFTTPAGGHGCLGAVIDVPGGPAISNNLDVIGCPAGQASMLSFLVFGGNAAEQMTLQLAESLESGAPIPAGGSWVPLLVAPPGTGPAAPTTAPVTLNLSASAFDSVGIQITIPPGATGAHHFHVTGFVGGSSVGEVDILVRAGVATAAPDPYLSGGYQSADILLFDSNGHPVPLGADPCAPGVTLLQPDTDYQMRAVVHNGSTTPANNVVVRFWQCPGGVGSSGTLLDVQSVSVPGLGHVEVLSEHPFHSAPAAHPHRCAAVSISCAQSAFPTDAVTALQVPDPNATPGHSPSAWRNTDSTCSLAGRPWQIVLQADPVFRLPDADPGPVRIEIQTLHAPVDFARAPRVAAVQQIIRQAGGGEYPLFLHPALQDVLQTADLQTKVTPQDRNTKMEMLPVGKIVLSAGQVTDGQSLDTPAAVAGGGGGTAVAVAPTKTGAQTALVPAAVQTALAANLHPAADKAASFLVSGVTPKDAQPGDVYIVRVTAHYPKTPVSPDRAVQFTQTIHVQG